ncbi:class I SAM-dependent methyltransferase [Acidiphilium iwatense]|nr:SAM-dependent methyltransferase [Acidiphilium iwatense]
MIERLDRFMARANAAYYATRDPFADFATSPEISQIFGELLGLWAGLVWQMMGSPGRIVLAEAGPGRGTLMRDALRAIRRALPDFAEAMSPHLIETSPRLIGELATALPDATIHSDLSGLPDGPIILIANEFLDALPIRQFVRRETGWTERHIENGRFIEVPADASFPANECGVVHEYGEAAEEFVAALAARIARMGGVALIVDYGSAQGGPGESLQAIRAGVPVDPLAEPGTADLTAHVDFARLAIAATEAGCSVSGPIAQGAFLAALGIHERTAQLGRAASPEMAVRLLAATRRLTSAEAMGSLFKTLAIRHPSMRIPPGFSA